MASTDWNGGRLVRGDAGIPVITRTSGESRGAAASAFFPPVAGENAAAWLRIVAVAVTFALPLLVAPGLERPFSTPKVALLVSAVVLFSIGAKLAGLLRWPALPFPFALALGMTLTALGISSTFGEVGHLASLALPLAGVFWFLMLLMIRPRTEHLLAALVFSGGCVALLAILQSAGADPFRWFGWQADESGNVRMRVFATLGNPNFVAAFLTGILPLTVAARRQCPCHTNLISVLLLLQGIALFATGSRAAVLGIAAMLVWLVLQRAPRNAVRTALVGVPVALALLALAPARSFSTTLNGRLFIWQVSLPHVLDPPVTGFGPGAFVEKYEQWEAEHWKLGRGAETQRDFSGAQDHAHNDYLEILLERGALGLAGFGGLLFSLFAIAWRRGNSAPSDLKAGSSAGVVALAAIAQVDFPFHRPAELALFWTLAAILVLNAAQERTKNRIPQSLLPNE